MSFITCPAKGVNAENPANTGGDPIDSVRFVNVVERLALLQKNRGWESDLAY